VTTPIYRRIAQELRQQIKSGFHEPGGQLPTELELAERYEASRNTVRDAIKWLAANSLVTILRTGYRAAQEGPLPYRVTFTVLPADRNQLVINSGKVPGHLAPAADQP
jgi:DNA-binding transcriptional regulator YhcF (GntR family)